MPLSLPPTAVDHVVDMEQIGSLLFDILRGVNLPATEKADNPLRDLLTQVSAQTNIDFRNYKSSTILRRIGRRMAVTHNANIRDYADYLRLHPDEVNELVRAFLIKVTGFFRDPEAYEFIKTSINPSYQQVLGDRNVTGLPLSEVFTGRDLDVLLKQLKLAVREAQTIRTQPIDAFMAEADGHGGHIIHTAVPVQDQNVEGVNRLFIYSEKPE